MLGRGKIDVSPKKTSYAPGETISGNVALTLGKPVKARELSISLIGQGETTVTTPGIQRNVSGSVAWVGRGGAGSTTVRCPVRICDLKQQLDSEKEYSEWQDYRFEMKIPAGILNMRHITGAKWHLLAKLDIPGGLDVSKNVDVTIG